MAFHMVQDTDGSTVMQEDAQGGSASEFKIRFADGAEIALGRGQTDPDITYIRLQNADTGESAYVFPDALQTSIVVQATRP